MKPLSHSKGFTLVEIIVVIGIIILLSAIIFPNYRPAQKQFALQRSASKLAQDIRRAQEMAMAAKETNLGGQVPPGEEFVPEGGYGIFFAEGNPNSYIIFADCNENKKYNGPGKVCGPTGTEYTEHVETIELETGVQINDIQKEGGGSPDRIYITFIPPDPETHIVPSAGSESSWCQIILALEEDLTETKTVIINKAGLIEIE